MHQWVYIGSGGAPHPWNGVTLRIFSLRLEKDFSKVLLTLLTFRLCDALYVVAVRIAV